MICSKRDCFLKDVFGIFVLAFIIRLVISIYTQGLFHPEAWEYEDIAVNLYNGKGFVTSYYGKEYYAYSTPLYPMLCAGVYKFIGHNQTATIILQMIISSFLCIIIYSITKDIFKRLTAILSSVFSALHPGSIIYSSVKLHALTLDAFMISLAIFSFIIIFKKPSFMRAIFCGIVYGLSVLTRSTITPFLFFGIIWLLWASKNNINFKEVIKYCFILTISGFLIIGIWLTRNFLVFKKFVPITTISAEVFWRGNNINATGTGFAIDSKAMLMSDPNLFSKFMNMNEMQRYNLLKSESERFIRTHPVKFILLTLKKFYYFWWFSPNSGKFYSQKYFVLYRYTYFFILLFSLVGIIPNFFRKQNDTYKKIMLLLILLLTISIGQSLFYIEGRHRLAIEPLLLIFTVNGLVVAKEKIKKIFIRQ